MNQLPLGRSLLYFRHGLTGRRLRSIPPPLRLQRVLLSLRLCLCPRSHCPASAQSLGTLTPPLTLVAAASPRSTVPAISLSFIGPPFVCMTPCCHQPQHHLDSSLDYAVGLSHNRCQRIVVHSSVITSHSSLHRSSISIPSPSLCHILVHLLNPLHPSLCHSSVTM